MMKFFLASGNAHKVTEFKAILSKFGIEICTPKDLNIDFDVEETGTTFPENAKIKAKAGFELSGLPTIADDSGLSIDALNGEPGVYSARYAGIGATDKQKIERVLSKLGNNKNRKAKFVCAISFYSADFNFTVQGECHGNIANKVKGENGFGYDPIFIPDGFDKSFAQITADEKNSISHRGRALIKFTEEIKKYIRK